MFVEGNLPGDAHVLFQSRVVGTLQLFAAIFSVPIKVTSFGATDKSDLSFTTKNMSLFKTGFSSSIFWKNNEHLKIGITHSSAKLLAGTWTVIKTMEITNMNSKRILLLLGLR